MAQTLDVLIIEDSPDDAGLIEIELKKTGYHPETFRIETKQALQKALQEKNWDIIISDYMLPGFDGLSALEMVRESGVDVPFILVSGKIGEELAVESVLSGAHDYVMKDNLKRIRLAVPRELKNKLLRDQKREADEKFRQSMREKEVMLKEIHHRVKNNLAVVSALLSLQADHVIDKKSRQFFYESVGRIKSMALIHEKLYQSEMLSKVALGEYLKELVFSIGQTYHNNNREVKLHISTDDTSLDITKAIPCGLIVNELLTNAYKYAFEGREKGNIYLNLKKDPGSNVCMIEVRDDGVGLSEDLITNRRQSFGFTIIRGLADQISADLTINNDAGTYVSMRFSL